MNNDIGDLFFFAKINDCFAISREPKKLFAFCKPFFILYTIH